MDAGDDRDPRDRGIGKVEDWALGTAVYHGEVALALNKPMVGNSSS